MKITATILSIPPYVSVAWKDICSLHTKFDSLGDPTFLVITLKSHAQVEVPHLMREDLEEIFDAFTKYNEQEKLAEKKALEGPFHFAIPLKKLPSGDTALPSSTAHNPDQANIPDLPPEMLGKLTQIAKIFGLEDTSLLPQPEEHCNCIHCQVIRSLHGSTPLPPIVIEEEVSENDLSFRNWEIKQTAEKLYLVTSRLDPNEHYTVFLGTPLGCTCGSKNCEHIQAVLSVPLT